MDLTELVATPKLLKLEIKDAEWESINDDGSKTPQKMDLTFHTYDRQPLDVFLKLSNSIGVDQYETIKLLKTLILDKDGNPVMKDNQVLPVPVMVMVMAKVMELLGK